MLGRQEAPSVQRSANSGNCFWVLGFSHTLGFHLPLKRCRDGVTECDPSSWVTGPICLLGPGRIERWTELVTELLIFLAAA